MSGGHDEVARSERQGVVVLEDGAQLWTATSGTGSPVVLCHGGPGLWDYLSDLAVLLEDDHTVVRFEQRGCGRSTGRDGPFTVTQAVDDLDQLRRALGVDRWSVVGHSWGAELALRYAATHPGRTSAVAYLAGVGAGDGSGCDTWPCGIAAWARTWGGGRSWGADPHSVGGAGVVPAAVAPRFLALERCAGARGGAVADPACWCRGERPGEPTAVARP